jgi:CDP-diacylglycerol--inositol 3-phosphatidyltransferase
MVLYIISCLLDAVDGNAARYFNQCSRFGTVLDMVTDRSTTSCLLCFLATKYSSWTILFQLLISLDLSSHYMHMYSSLTSGSSSHKDIDESSNKILRAYYSDNRVLFIFCALNELFFVALYLLSFDHEGIVPWLNYTIKVIAVISFPVCTIKQIINVIQLAGASQRLANLDLVERRKIPKNGENAKNH